MNYVVKIIFFLFAVGLSKISRSQCTFNLGPDILYCQGKFVPTPIKAPANYDSYLWNTGETTATITASTAGTYYCTATLISKDLITNGNFDAGATGFSSSYTIGTGGPYGPVSSEGTYYVTTNPNLAHTNFPAFGDHTNGSGSMMVVNGSGAANSSIWCQNIAVKPNTDYNFSAWIASCYAASQAELPKLQFSINSSLLGSVFSPPFVTAQWFPFNATWNSGNSASAAICIVNQNTALSGNDFALDDIFFQEICKSSDTIKVETIPDPVATITSPATLNCKTTSVILQASSSVSNVSYSWAGPGGFSSSLQEPEVTEAGTYTVTVATANGCTGSATVNVNSDKALPDVSAGADQTLDCVKNSATLNGSSSTPGVVYSWSGPSFTSSIATPSVTKTGTYVLTVTNPVNGCSATSSVQVRSTTAIPDVNAGTDKQLTCSVKNVNLNGSSATAGASFLWRTPSGTTSSTSTINVSVAGSYSLTVTDPANGCTASATVNVTSDTSKPDVDAGKDQSFNCLVSTITLQGVSTVKNVSYLWSGPGGFNFTQSNVSVSTAGLYTLSVTNTSNGCVSMDSVILSPAAPPIVLNSTKTDVACYHGNNGAASITASGGTPPYRYSWNSGATSNALSSLNAGTYTCVVTDVVGCADTLLITVNEPPELILAPLANDTICPGKSVTINPLATGGTPGYTYVIRDDHQNVMGTTLTPAVTTVYAVVATDQNGCVSSAQSFSIRVLPALSLTITDVAPVCKGDCRTLSAHAKGGLGVYAYTWLPGNENGLSIQVCPDVTTTYTVQVTDACGQLQISTLVAVAPSPAPQITLSDSAGCSPLCLKSWTTPVTGTTYAWYVDNNNNGNAGEFSDCLPAGTHIIQLRAINSAGCKGVASDTVFVYPHPQARFSHTPDDATVLNPLIQFINASTGATSYQWDLGTGKQSKDANPALLYPDKKECYPIFLKAFNQFGCADSARGEVCINDVFTIYFPNAFTPDGDGLNDSFKPKGSGIDPNKYRLLIYDRWGNLVFETKQLEEGWNGKRSSNKEENCLMDTYVWKCDLRDINGGYHALTGIVTIVK